MPSFHHEVQGHKGEFSQSVCYGTQNPPDTQEMSDLGLASNSSALKSILHLIHESPVNSSTLNTIQSLRNPHI